MVKDFSKCQCPQAGWCDLLKKEMTANPPNWQWCQGLTEQERHEYHDKVNGKVRTLRQAIRRGWVDTVNFVDVLPERKSDHAVCVIPANDHAAMILDHTRDSIKAYADKCGADYIELTGDQQPAWPMGNKYRVYNVSSVYDKTLYLDCDITIKEDSPNIFELTPDDKLTVYEEMEIWEERCWTSWIQNEQDIIVRKFLEPQERDKFLYNGKFTATRMFNGGVMVIPKSMAEYYKQPDKPYLRQWCFDQNYLTFILPEDKHHQLDDKFNLTWQAMHLSEGTAAATVEWAHRARDSYFLHVNGEKSDKLRLFLLTMDFDDKTTMSLIPQNSVSLSNLNWCPQAQENQEQINDKLYAYVKNQEQKEVDFDKDVSVAIIGHCKQQWDTIEKKPWMKIVDVNTLTGDYSENTWAESRAYAIENLFPDEAKYVGFVTASWNSKYSSFKKIQDLDQWDTTQILLNSEPEDKVYLCADLYCACIWLRTIPNTVNRHGIISDVFGSSKYPTPNIALKTLLKYINLDYKFGHSKHRAIPYSNQGIYHRSIYDSWIGFLKDEDVFEKVKWITHKFNLYEDHLRWSHRPYAYFMEAVNCYWCINQDFNYIATTSRSESWYDNSVRDTRGW